MDVPAIAGGVAGLLTSVVVIMSPVPLRYEFNGLVCHEVK